MAEALINLGMILTYLTSPSFHNELSWAARAMDGETGGVMHDKITSATWVAHTIYNRTASPDFPNTIEEVVIDGFKGHVHSPDPDPDMYTLAMQVFIERILYPNAIPPVYYMYSFHDMKNLGLDRFKIKTFKCFYGAPYFGLCFFKEYPNDT